MTDLERAQKALLNARKIVCFSGAGISAESGIPTYQDKLTGLWSCHSPARLETANAFRENPRLVWGWYLWRRQQSALAQPNMGHHALSRMQRRDAWFPSLLKMLTICMSGQGRKRFITCMLACDTEMLRLSQARGATARATNNTRRWSAG